MVSAGVGDATTTFADLGMEAAVMWTLQMHYHGRDMIKPAERKIVPIGKPNPGAERITARQALLGHCASTISSIVSTFDEHANAFDTTKSGSETAKVLGDVHNMRYVIE